MTQESMMRGGSSSGSEAACKELKAYWETLRAEYLDTSDEIAYHFTSSERCVDIISERLLYMGDAKKARGGNDEMKCGFRVLGELFQRRRDHYGINENAVPRLCLHIACLSRELLIRNQWKTFANNGDGCAIGFRLGNVLSLCHQLGIFQFPMEYRRDRQEEMLEKFIRRYEEVRSKFRIGLADDPLDREWRRGLGTFICAMKDRDHSDEREWRIHATHDSHLEPKVVPGEERCFRALPISAPGVIDEIVRGPRCAKNISQIRKLLDTQGFTGVGVRDLSRKELRMLEF